jgi:hypothetical protein
MTRYFKTEVGSFNKAGKAQYFVAVIPVEHDGETEKELLDIVKKGVVVHLHRKGETLNFINIKESNFKEYCGHTLGLV